MEFENFLKEKKIDSQAFKATEPELWKELQRLFLQVNPKSFISQKLYLINPIRRKYPLKEEFTQKKVEANKKASKPVVKPTKPKTGKPIIKRPKIN